MKLGKKLLTFIFLSLTTFAFSDQRDDFIKNAKTYLGTRYVYAGTTRAGIDCSGFIMAAARDAKLMVLPHSAKEIYRLSTKINKSELLPGDLVFFSSWGSVDHVGIYLGNNQMIHSASSGPKTGVIISSLSENYWSRHYYACGRIISSTTISEPTTEIAKTQETKPEVQKEAKAETQISTPQKSKTNSSDHLPIAIDLSGYLDWTVLTIPEQTIGAKRLKSELIIQGVTVEPHLRTALWKCNPGIMAKFMFDENFKKIGIPVCLTFNVSHYFSAYAGVTFASEIDSFQTGQKVSNSKTYPEIFGIKLQLPLLIADDLRYGFCLVQDISYTHFKSVDANENFNVAQKIISGLYFQTGLKIIIH